jgi:dimethylargininase
MKYTKAIVRRPCRNIIKGLTSANLGTPDYNKSLEQHNKYVEALQGCGLDVTVLEADNNYPDSVFVEDTALMTPTCAIITNPGALSRRGEEVEIEKVLLHHYSIIERINPPGTVDAGDILMVDTNYYIGLSSRTNAEGARQLGRILNSYGMTHLTIPFKGILHLKSGIAYLENNVMVITGGLRDLPEFQGYSLIEIEDEEEYAANCIWINGIVLLADGFPKTRRMIEDHGYRTIVLDVTEYRKMDGGLSCLSLRF